MMRKRTKATAIPLAPGPGSSGAAEARGHEWEMRPGGMLVQKRSPDSDGSSAQAPVIRVRVKYNSVYHEISISSQATFGELKKMLTARTGLHHEDQKLMYKDKERDSKAFLDITGVKDRSKLVLAEDPIKQEKRLLEMRRNAKVEKASKAISEISLEVDRLGGQVSALETVINKGGKVAEKNVVNLIELLMNLLVKLDGITADGDVRLQRKMQVTRVQRHVETLDLLKIKNSTGNSNGGQISTKKHWQRQNGQKLAPILEQPPRESNESIMQSPKNSETHNLHLASLMDMPMQLENHEDDRHQCGQRKDPAGSRPIVVTTTWETFESSPAPAPAPAPALNSHTSKQDPPRFNWEFFD